MAKLKELATEQRPNIVWLLLSWIGGAMLSTSILTSLLHWLQSIPLNLQLILSLFILSLFLLAAAYFFARRQPGVQIVTTPAPGLRQDGEQPLLEESSSAEVQQLRDRVEELEGQIYELGSENIALVKQGDAAIKHHEQVRRDNDALQMSLIKKSDYIESNKWLYEIAERDKREIDKYVVAKDPVVFYAGLRDDYPYFVITFKVFNYSVYPISIDSKDVKGSIYRNDKELSGNLKMEGDVINLPRDGNHWDLAVKQWVDPREAELLVNPLLDIHLKFDRLIIIIKGGEGTSGIEPKRLRLPSFIPVAETQPPNIRVNELKARIEELEKGTAQDRRLQEIATEDRQQINRMVVVRECDLAFAPNASTPYVKFTLTISNYSLYPITIDRKIEGEVWYAHRQLNGKKTVSTKWTLENIQRGFATRFEFSVSLSPEDAEFIVNDLNPQNSFFSFEQLSITVRGGDGFDDIPPKPIRFGFRGVNLQKRLC